MVLERGSRRHIASKQQFHSFFLFSFSVFHKKTKILPKTFFHSYLIWRKHVIYVFVCDACAPQAKFISSCYTWMYSLCVHICIPIEQLQLTLTATTTAAATMGGFAHKTVRSGSFRSFYVVCFWPSLSRARPLRHFAIQYWIMYVIHRNYEFEIRCTAGTAVVYILYILCYIYLLFLYRVGCLAACLDFPSTYRIEAWALFLVFYFTIFILIAGTTTIFGVAAVKLKRCRNVHAIEKCFTATVAALSR